MRFLSISTLVTILAYISLYCVQMSGLADDPGVGWHLKTGELIATTGSIPHADPFLAPAPTISQGGGRRWISDQWLSDLLLYELTSYGDWPVVYVFFAGVWIVTFFAVVGPGIRTQVGAALGSTLVTLVAFKLGQVHFVVRPVVFSICLFAIVHRIARRIATDVVLSGRQAIVAGAVLCGIFMMWSNIHPAFVLGVCAVLMIYPARLLAFGWNAECCLSVCLLPLFCLVATLFNPYGLELHRSILDLGSSEYLMKLNTEWRPTDFTSLPGGVIAVMALLPFLSWVCFKRSRKHIHVFDLLVLGGLFFECVKHIRFMPYTGIAAAYPCAGFIKAWGEIEWQPLRLSRRFFGAIERHEARCATTSSAAILCAVVGFGVLVGPGLLFLSPPGPSPSRYPPALAEAIRGDAESGVIFATPDLGGFITANLYPRFRAVMDDRNTLVGESMYRRYFKVIESLDEMQAVVEEFAVTHVILDRQKGISKELTTVRHWPVIYQDEAYVTLRVVR